jgi:hypothetical protein
LEKVEEEVGGGGWAEEEESEREGLVLEEVGLSLGVEGVVEGRVRAGGVAEGEGG